MYSSLKKALMTRTGSVSRSGLVALWLFAPAAWASAPDLPPGVGQGDWQSVAAQISVHQHRIGYGGDGWRAKNSGQQWQTRFDAQGFLIRPQGAEWSWGLSLRGYGAGAAQREVTGQAVTQVAGNRMEYLWDDNLTEWMINDARGLEHGFTLRHRPAGEGDGLRLTLQTRGELRPRAQADGRGASFAGASGVDVINYSGLKVFDAQGRDLPARIEVADDTLHLAVDDRAAVYPVTIDPWAKKAYIKASNTGTDDSFGIAVAIDGDTLVVGAPNEASAAKVVNGDQTDDSAPGAGAVYVFVRDGSGSWSQQAYLKAANAGGGDQFGSALAIDGDSLVVGASTEASNATGVNGNGADNSATMSGAAYVFVRSGTTWSQQAYLKASNTQTFDFFGQSVAIFGDTLVVGATGEDSKATGVNGNQADNSYMNPGAAYVFVRNGTTWSQQAYLKASNTEGFDSFGRSVAISGDTLVVSADGEDSSATGLNGNQTDNSVPAAGAAYVFTRSGTTWSQQAYLKASNPGSNDCFGWSLAISGDTLVVAAYRESSSATGVDGSGSDNGAADAGAAYVFVRDGGGGWSQQAYLKASNTGAGDYFGESVAISGDTLVVGAPYESSSATGVNGDQTDDSASMSGAAYVFARSGTAWSQQAYFKASNTETRDFFGSSVAVSGDTLVVGAYFESSSATGLDGDQTDDTASHSGAAYLFTLAAAPAEKRIYVKADAAGSSTGADWTNAYAKLADALAAANPGDDIWVAKGSYYPDEGAGRADNDVTASFAIPDGIQLYGGFAGTETAVDQRDWAVNRTILSGDIGQDDTDTDGNRISESWNQIQGSNSRHVATTGNVAASTLVDGFIITGGDGGAGYDGGGWYNNGGSPTLTNIAFQGNRGNYGGGLYSSGNPDLANVVFAGNRAGQQGGGFFSASGSPAIAHASFSGNSAGSAAGAGGGAVIAAGAPVFRNSILWGDANGELYVASGATPSFANSLIQGCGGSSAWSAACGTDGGNNKDANPLFANAAVGDLRLSSASSPAWNAGGNTLIPAGLAGDLGGAPRIQQTTVDMGAYEQTLFASPVVTGSSGDDAVVIQRTTTTVNAGDGNDVVYNALGKQTLTGGPGADRFVYTGITERTDIIEDFSGDFGAEEGDRLDLSRLLGSLGCKASAGCNPLAAGSYVSFQDAAGGVYVMIDIDGPGPLTSKTQLVFLRNVTAAQINSPGNFVF